ncbi:uncharacterized protein EDB93DRAFT_1090613 [Suillus bovinus]|uniref:uncharacterized protein n=1 Tax=Suillus bovinus TaxID=48563 RepID=UPI001B867DDA|nr:uncharacterized protein EDB93DRAFT_1090613 [Suillus bovinus]KAG2138634.1 hypothetical protein EDB93DRAFT_1090613 [Suillus bovinus]
MTTDTSEANDVFSLSDHLLAERLQFVKEIGFGNWGSVWLCRPKSSSSSNKHKDVEVAVKLVHRSKTSTTAARVRSLWNEMKIVRSFKADPHPSIIPFHSFIITPSYALITMAYLPTLVPVEVSEPRAKEWFRSLLSGVHFLHERGVVHNDIKPANILLSHKNIPVLVDFGFAEKYDLSSPKAFHSNLTYGTPEYLSPERARGLPHDTRKSDIWSLGVTFFEILIGRTPFEYEEGEQFASKADLEKYWSRTMRGKWVGAYTIPRPVEKLLKRMIVPNADLRCTAKQAMADVYWQAAVPDKLIHSPSLKDTSTPKDAVPKDAPVSRRLDISLPWSSNSRSPSRSSVSRTPEKEIQEDTRVNERHHARSKSQPKLRSPYPHADGYRQGRKLSTVQGSPVVKGAKKLGPTPLASVDASNTSRNMNISSGFYSLNSLTPVPKSLGLRTPSNLALRDMDGGRKKGARTGRENTPRAKENSPVVDGKGNTPQHKGNCTPKMSGRKPCSRSRANVLADLTGFAKNNTSRTSLNDHHNASTPDLGNVSTAVNVSGMANTTSSTVGKGSVRDRMREWERERERLREMERLTEMQREAESIMTSANGNINGDNETELSDEEVECAIEREEAQEARRSPVSSGQKSPLGVHMKDEVLTEETDSEIDPNVTSYRADLSSEHIEIARIGVRASAQLLEMSKGSVRMYKSSTLGQLTGGRTTPVWCASPEPIEFEQRRSGEAGRFSYEEIRPENSAEKERETALHRMNLWIQNVERVVEETRQNFAFASTSITPPPALPLSPPISRSNSQALNANISRSSSRLPKRMLAANEIFCDDPNAPLSPGRSALADQSNLLSGYMSPDNSGFTQRAGVSTINVLSQTPRRQRRATISTRSPKADENDMDGLGSPSKRREKSRSQGNLDRHIRPVDKLEFDLTRETVVAPTPRLSAILDRKMFIASPIMPWSGDVDETEMQTPYPIRRRSILFDDTDITASPFHVEPYPPRKSGEQMVINSPDLRRVEGVYDRFLMSTTGVKRVGKGYQSDNLQPVHTASSTLECKPANNNPRNFNMFSSTRRAMPQPVSSDDMWGNASVDELGVVACSAGTSRSSKEDSKNTATAALVLRAFKAIVPGRTVSRRLSRTIVA